MVHIALPCHTLERSRQGAPWRTSAAKRPSLQGDLTHCSRANIYDSSASFSVQKLYAGEIQNVFTGLGNSERSTLMWGCPIAQSRPVVPRPSRMNELKRILGPDVNKFTIPMYIYGKQELGLLQRASLLGVNLSIAQPPRDQCADSLTLKSTSAHHKLRRP
jgi:hypothetical protein